MIVSWNMLFIVDEQNPIPVGVTKILLFLQTLNTFVEDFVHQPHQRQEIQIQTVWNLIGKHGLRWTQQPFQSRTRSAQTRSGSPAVCWRWWGHQFGGIIVMRRLSRLMLGMWTLDAIGFQDVFAKHSKTGVNSIMKLCFCPSQYASVKGMWVFV